MTELFLINESSNPCCQCGLDMEEILPVLHCCTNPECPNYGLFQATLDQLEGEECEIGGRRCMTISMVDKNLQEQSDYWSAQGE